VDKITDNYAAELNKLKSLAIGTLGGVVREMATSAAPLALADRVKDVVDGFTKKLGGEPVEGPILNEDASGTPEGGKEREERHEAKMGRPLGAAQG